MSEMTLAEMAREIERRRKNTLPKSLAFNLPNPLHDTLWILSDDHSIVPSCPDDIAHCCLRDAMVMATRAKRCTDGWEYVAWIEAAQTFHMVLVLDSDHGNCPTRSLYAAFCAVFPEPKETPDA